MQFKSEKKIQACTRAQEFYDNGAVLYQLRYWANLEMVALYGRNIPVDGLEYNWIYER